MRICKDKYMKAIIDLKTQCFIINFLNKLSRDGNPSNFWAGFGFRILKESVKKSDGFLRIPDSYFWRIPDSDSGF